MLLGCWLLSEALEIQAGQVASLVLLMAVLQVYEGILVGLGAFLVRSGQNRRRRARTQFGRGPPRPWRCCTCGQCTVLQ
jgi:hypothetical protein